MFGIMLDAGEGLAGADGGNAGAAGAHEGIADGLSGDIAHDLVHHPVRLYRRVIMDLAGRDRGGDIAVKIMVIAAGRMMAAVPGEEIVFRAILGPGDKEFLNIGDQTAVVMRRRILLLPVHQNVAVKMLFQIAFQIMALIGMEKHHDLSAPVRIDYAVIETIGQAFIDYLIAGWSLTAPFTATAVVEIIRRVHAVTVKPAQFWPNFIGVSTIQAVRSDLKKFE